MDAGDAVAIYAAIVATGALALEIRRWVESGPRISVRANAGMTLTGGERTEDESDLLAVTAYNRGDQPTTVTHMLIVRFPNRWRRWRNRPSETYAILKPEPSGHSPALPKELPTGGQWMGFAKPGFISADVSSEYWAGIQTTDRERAYLAPIAWLRVTQAPRG